MQTLNITGKEEGQRLDKYLKKYLSKAPGSFIYKMLRKKNITLNAKKASGAEILKEGDAISLYLSDETIGKFHEDIVLEERGASHVPYSVIYADANILVVNKPAGLLTQKGSVYDTSLADGLVPVLLERHLVTEEDLRAFHPSPVNRLDRNTSGLVLCGVSLRGAQFLSEMIRSRHVRKIYLALVHGSAVPEGRVTTWFTRNHADNTVHLTDRYTKMSEKMVTEFHVLAKGQGVSLVLCELITGKTHQIRAQLSFCGAPILGDPKYGSREVNARVMKRTGVHRQLLHSYITEFPALEGDFAGLSKKIFTAPLPEDFLCACTSFGIDPKTELEK